MRNNIQLASLDRTAGSTEDMDLFSIGSRIKF